MKTFNKFSAVVVLAIAFVLGVVGSIATAFAATSPTLGDAESYSVLAGSIVTNTGATTMPGNLGISPSIGVPPHVSGFPPGVVGPPGAIHDADSDAAAAQSDNTAAFGFLDQNCDVTYAGTQNLAGLSLAPGVYCANAFELSGTLTLSGTSGVWIFKSASTLVTSGTANIVGGDPCNVWWREVSSATLGVGTSLIGNVLASTAITIASNATLSGRAMTQTAAVTLASNTITEAVCTAATEEEDTSENNNDVAIKVKKTANPSTLSGPGSVTYTYKVSNEGDVSLKDVSVKDDKCSPVVYVSGKKDKDGKLDKDEVWKYTCTKKVFATETNKVTAKGTANGNRAKDTDKATVVVSSVPGFPNAGVGPDNDNFWNITYQKILSFFSF